MKEINFRAPLNLVGFGLFSMAYFKNMSKFAKINWESIGTPSHRDIKKLCKEFNVCEEDVVNALDRPLNTDLPLFTIWHHHDLAYEDYDIRALIHFETSTFTPTELDSISKVTKIAACSNWAKNTIDQNLQKANIDVEAFILPGIYASIETMDANSIRDLRAPIKLLKDRYSADKFFVSGGKWEKRKQHYKLLSKTLVDATPNKVFILGLWNNVFTGGLTEPQRKLQEVGYALKERITTNGFESLEVYTSPTSPIIIGMMGFINSMQLMHDIYVASDGYISLSAGEGWDQPLVEAMSLGLSCLATDNTAHIQYTHSDNCTIIDCGQEIAFDGTFFRGDKGVWYPPTENSLKQKWAEFCSLVPEEIKEIGDRARIDMVEDYEWMQQNLEELLDDFLG